MFKDVLAQLQKIAETNDSTDLSDAINSAKMTRNESVNSTRSYVVVHNQRGSITVPANSAYGAVMEAAAQWGINSTIGLDAYLEDTAQVTTENDIPDLTFETIEELEERVTYNDLAKLSGIEDPNKIYPGQKITLPGGGSYTVKSGDTLSHIAQDFRLGKIGQPAPAPAPAPVPAPTAKNVTPTMPVEYPTEKKPLATPDGGISMPRNRRLNTGPNDPFGDKGFERVTDLPQDAQDRLKQGIVGTVGNGNNTTRPIIAKLPTVDRSTADAAKPELRKLPYTVDKEVAPKISTLPYNMGKEVAPKISTLPYNMGKEVAPNRAGFALGAKKDLGNIASQYSTSNPPQVAKQPAANMPSAWQKAKDAISGAVNKDSVVYKGLNRLGLFNDEASQEIELSEEDLNNAAAELAHILKLSGTSGVMGMSGHGMARPVTENAKGKKSK